MISIRRPGTHRPRFRGKPHMSYLSRKLACWLFAAAIMLVAGCMPRGPFPLATLFGEKEAPDCGDGSCYNRCRRGGHRENGDDASATTDTPAPILAPHSNFHPVPTRPVFTPWAVESAAPEEISGQLAWKQAVTAGQAAKSSTAALPVELPSTVPIARRPLPPPANLPDEKPAQPQTGIGDSDSRGEPAPPGWHTAPSRF
jgi:hypothetical protein